MSNLADTDAIGDLPWDNGSHANRGNNNYYPLLSPLNGGGWNTLSPGYLVIVDAVGNPVSVTPGSWEDTVLEAIKAALAKDGNGNSRFKENIIDLGAVEK
jgi:hypothetical protein